MKAFFLFLIRDPLRKLIALLLTVVLYAVLNEGKQQHKDIADVPLRIKCDEDVFISKTMANTTLQIAVKGSESRIKNLDMQSIYAQVAVSRRTPGFDSGSITLQLEPKDFITPPGIEVISIEPRTIVLPVEKKISKDIPIVPVVVGAPRKGLAHDGGRCFPYMVTVSGSERAMRDLQEIKTEPVTIPRGESRTFSKSVNLISPGEDFTMNITRTDVTVTINTDMSHQVAGVPVHWNMPLNRRIEVRPGVEKVTVTVAGQQDEIKLVSADDIHIYVDLSDPKYEHPGKYEVPVSGFLKSSGNTVRIGAIKPDVISVECVITANTPKAE